MACESDDKIPDGVDCKGLCNVNEACHPHGLDDTEHNIHNWYDDLSTIPEHFFASTESFQKLKDIIQKCFEARDRCEKCIQKNIKSISSTPHLISDKIQGYWYRVYLGLEGKTPAKKIRNTEKLMTHILERDKAKILYDVVILNKRPPHHDLIGPKPAGTNSIFRIFRKILKERYPDRLEDWEVVQMAPAGCIEPEPQPCIEQSEPESQPENQGSFKAFEVDDSDNESLEECDEDVSAMSKSSRPKDKINQEYLLFKKLDKDNDGFINIDSPQWQIVLNIPLNIVQQIYDSLDILDSGIITMEQFINGYNIITTAIDNYMLDEAIREQSLDETYDIVKISDTKAQEVEKRKFNALNDRLEVLKADTKRLVEDREKKEKEKNSAQSIIDAKKRPFIIKQRRNMIKKLITNIRKENKPNGDKMSDKKIFQEINKKTEALKGHDHPILKEIKEIILEMKAAAAGSKKKRKRRKKRKYNGGGNRKLTKRRTNKKNFNKINIYEKNYNKLLDMKKNKKTLSKFQQRNLDKALHIKYCTCVKSLKYSQKNPAAYGICANSVYKNRGFEMPPRAARNCNKYKK